MFAFEIGNPYNKFSVSLFVALPPDKEKGRLFYLTVTHEAVIEAPITRERYVVEKFVASGQGIGREHTNVAFRAGRVQLNIRIPKRLLPRDLGYEVRKKAH